mmetsp:Transcript_21650/g.36877  ORF Transcript_21650/g.36877 Transcript_21650/m.36877 type:complete len:203 (-) Transcript_21650:686-1294(-)
MALRAILERSSCPAGWVAQLLQPCTCPTYSAGLQPMPHVTSYSTDQSSGQPQLPATKPSLRERRRGQHLAYKQSMLLYKQQTRLAQQQWRAGVVLQYPRGHAVATPQQEPMPVQQIQRALAVEVQRAELEVELACIKLERATRWQNMQLSLQQNEERRRQMLLEASKHWIRKEELLDAINQALDSPQPFGFIQTNRRVKHAL